MHYRSPDQQHVKNTVTTPKQENGKCLSNPMPDSFTSSPDLFDRPREKRLVSDTPLPHTEECAAKHIKVPKTDGDISDNEEGAVGFCDTLTQRLEDNQLSLDSGFVTGTQMSFDLSAQFSTLTLSINDEGEQLSLQDECSQLSDFAVPGENLYQGTSCVENVSCNTHDPLCSSQVLSSDNTKTCSKVSGLLPETQSFLTEAMTVSTSPTVFGGSSLSSTQSNIEAKSDERPTNSNTSFSVIDGHASAEHQREQAVASASQTPSLMSESGATTKPATPGPVSYVPKLKDVQTMKKIVKSPLVRRTYSRTDEYVEDAIKAFEKSIELSNGNNTPALYEVALIYCAVGDRAQALRLLEKILRQIKSVRPYERVSAYEQAGLILKEMSQETVDKEESDRLRRDGHEYLEMALLICSKLCMHLPHFQPFIRRTWHSFHVLMESIERERSPEAYKNKEKAKLLQLIRENLESNAHLNALIQADPSEMDKPDYLWLKIKNHVDLGQYKEALDVFLLHKFILQAETAQREEDEHYSFVRICILAARDDLRNAASKAQLDKAQLDKAQLDYAKEVLSLAFGEFEQASKHDGESSDECASASESEYSDDEDAMPTVHIMILHDDCLQEQVQVLSEMLQEVCGLGIKTCNQTDYMPGRLFMTSIHQALCRSQMAIVLAGSERKSSMMSLLLDKAARKRLALTLLLEGGSVPSIMRRHPSRECPCALLQPTDNPAEAVDHTDITSSAPIQASAGEEEEEEDRGWLKYCDPEMIDSICDLFAFITHTKLYA
jgi:tetratricopeptide (TPR) repeat protein